MEVMSHAPLLPSLSCSALEMPNEAAPRPKSPPDTSKLGGIPWVSHLLPPPLCLSASKPFHTTLTKQSAPLFCLKANILSEMFQRCPCSYIATGWSLNRAVARHWARRW